MQDETVSSSLCRKSLKEFINLSKLQSLALNTNTYVYLNVLRAFKKFLYRQIVVLECSVMQRRIAILVFGINICSST
jgi:hypothetical protein